MLDERITKAITTTLDVVLEIHEKQRAKRPLLPFDCDLGEMEILVGPSAPPAAAAAAAAAPAVGGSKPPSVAGAVKEAPGTTPK